MLFYSQVQDILQRFPWAVKRKRKNELRALIEQKRRVYNADAARSDSAAIVARIEQTAVFRNAKVVLLYYPIRNEVDLRTLVDKYQGEKTFLLPVTHHDRMTVCPYRSDDQLRLGHSRVPEPLTAPYRGNIDLILTPGVVFDHHLHRIGRGGGYYDRFLRRHRRAFSLGVCYDFQLSAHTIPRNYWDKPVNGLVTPRLTIV